MQELASIIKLSSYNTFSLFECRKAVTGSKSSESGIGMSWVILPYLSILLFTHESVNAKADMNLCICYRWLEYLCTFLCILGSSHYDVSC
jgi:hypothetical protein